MGAFEEQASSSTRLALRPVAIAMIQIRFSKVSLTRLLVAVGTASVRLHPSPKTESCALRATAIRVASSKKQPTLIPTSAGGCSEFRIKTEANNLSRQQSTALSHVKAKPVWVSVRAELYSIDELTEQVVMRKSDLSKPLNIIRNYLAATLPRLYEVAIDNNKCE